MHRHGPKSLGGPASKKRLRWLAVTAGDAAGNDATAAQVPAEDRPGEEPEVRKDLIERVRRDIALGNYDTPEKWEQALNRLIDDIERK